MHVHDRSRSKLNSVGVGLLVGGIGLLLVDPAAAQHANGYNQPEQAFDIPHVNYASSSRIYQDAGEQLSTDMERLHGECCPSPSCHACGTSAGCAGCGACAGCGQCACPSPCNDGCCDLGEPFKLHDTLFGDNNEAYDMGGWMQWGYHNEGNGLFNDHPNNVNLHQFWLYAEKVADGSDGPDWGYRADLVYGVDAQDTQAFGGGNDSWDNQWDNGIYGWAIPQLYAEFAYGDLSIKAGHFFTLVGYEVVPATGNFFYSHAYTMFNSEPFTHSGVLATYSATDNVELYAGWTAGWDTGFDQFDDGSNFLGGASLTLLEDLTLTYITTIGDLGKRGEGYSHSIVMDAQLTEELNYVFHSDLVETNGGGDHQFSVNQYLIYWYNDCLGAGTRVEWWKNGGNSQYEATWGVNYKPVANIVVRPEYRYDWNPGTGQEFDTFGVDAILTF